MTQPYIGNHVGIPNGWDERFFGMAKLVSKWSKDPSTKVGAVIVDELNRVVSVGFNGLPMGVIDSPERYNDREFKYPAIVHGDANAILFAQRSIRGCKIYTYPFPPCSRCAGLIIQSGIQAVLAPVPSDSIMERWGDDLVIAARMYDEAGTHIYLVDYR